jgi:hypothetical protein
MKFLYETILIRLGCPKRLVTDNATTFKADALVDMCKSMGIQLVHSTSYYPQVTDNAATFKADALVDMCNSMGIQLVHSTSYYPQGNGLVESSNKSLFKIIRKLLEENQKRWDSKLNFSLWVDKVTNKKSIGTSLFKLVYGTDAIFPIQLVLPMANFFQEEQTESNDMVRRMLDLVEL